MGSNPVGPVDDRIGVLSVHEAESKRRIALVVTCTAHGNVLKGDNLLVSGDFPGWTRRLLQGALACPVLVHNGAAGNVNALYRGSLADLERMAQAVSDPVLGLLPELTPASDAPLWCRSVHVQAPLLPLPEPDAAAALAATVHERWGVDTAPWLQAVQAMYAKGRAASLPGY